MIKNLLLLIFSPLGIVCYCVCMIFSGISVLVDKIPVVREIVAATSLPVIFLICPISFIYEYAFLKLIGYRAEIENEVVIFKSKLFRHNEIGLDQVKCLEVNHDFGKSAPRLELKNGKHLYLARITNLEEFVENAHNWNIKYVNHFDT